MDTILAKTRPFFLIAFLCLLHITSYAQKNPDYSEKKNSDPFGWNNISITAKPATFWWWLGSCVNETEIERQLNMLKKAGFGAVTVCPLYEYKNPTIPPIEYLSDRWVDVFKFTLAKGKELGMLVDMPTGGGWPMGGPWITKENSERDWRLEVLALNVTTEHPVILHDEEGKDPIKCVTLLNNSTGDLNFEASKNKQPAKVIEPKIEGGNCVWHIPTVGKCNVLVARMSYCGSMVYVAGNGGKGPVFDYWSPVAFENLIQPLNILFRKLGTLRPRAIYCDSFEGAGGTTPDFFTAFKKVNGYDVRPYMHQYLCETGTPENVRLWHDYRATIAFLHVEFVKRWRQWANQNGMLTRYQYTGDPANPINTCGEADLPEDAPPFNTSAAHIFGKKLISAEEYTWGAGHNFKDYLDYYRKRGDADLMQGLNYKVYHGTPFTPLSESWPGPMYYAGGNFSETQPFFKHIRYLNDYFSKLQQILQDSKPDMDILMLWSIHDFWNMPNVGGFHWNQPFVWRNSNSAIYREDVKENTRSELVKRGLQTDFCSDEVITELTGVENGKIKAGKTAYKILLIPETKMIGAKTLEKLELLARDGATIIFMKNIPVATSSGLPLIQDLSQSTKVLETMAKAGKIDRGGVYIAADMQELLGLLHHCGLMEDGMPDKLSTLRVNRDGRTIYLIRNNTTEYLDLWVPLLNFDANCSQILVGNPRTGSIMLTDHQPHSNKGQLVHLVFEPSELLTATEIKANEKWQNIKSIDYRIKDHIIPLKENWEMTWSDYQGIQHQLQCDTLRSWTEWPELGLFSGIVSYTTNFILKNQELKKQWILDAGLVHESAEVFINGKKVGCVWTTPFLIDISGYLKNGKNILVLKVVNKSQNRIIDMNRKGIFWQKSKLEEVSDDRTTSGPLRIDLLKPVSSGLLGPVQLRCAE